MRTQLFAFMLVFAFMLQAAGFTAATAEPILTEQTEQARVQVVEIASGLEFPWSAAFAPGGDILVTELPGRLRVIRNGALLPAPVPGLPTDIYYEADAGLMDVVLDPDFRRNRTLYLSYAAGDVTANRLEVLRARMIGDRLVDTAVIFRAAQDKKGHGPLGGRLLFLPDGALLVSVGDGYDVREEAQNLDSHLGSFVRTSTDGAPVPDNPFAAPGAGDAKGRPEIFSWGHRTPQGLALRPATQEVWSHEHGPKGGDEVNIIKAGVNYGWPLATYGVAYDGSIISEHTEVAGTQQPVYYWLPSIAPSGMAFYDGEAFPHWKDDLLIGALAGQHLHRLELDGDRVQHGEAMLEDLAARIRDVRVGPDGLVYLLTDDLDGRLLRVEPAR